ncbi:MAG: hypothetical protein M3R02_01385 [Chloroflexota bacterium]|nr:hypothetical protein [Chloroflexota bacterium]
MIPPAATVNGEILVGRLVLNEGQARRGLRRSLMELQTARAGSSAGSVGWTMVPRFTEKVVDGGGVQGRDRPECLLQ